MSNNKLRKVVESVRKQRKMAKSSDPDDPFASYNHIVSGDEVDYMLEHIDNLEKLIKDYDNVLSKIDNYAKLIGESTIATLEIIGQSFIDLDDEVSDLNGR